MQDNPDMQSPGSSQGKLILPAAPAEEQAQQNLTNNNSSTQFYDAPPFPSPPPQRIRPDRSNTPPRQPPPVSRLREMWQRDPAYKVLIIGVAFVVVAGILFATLVAHALTQNFNADSSPGNGSVLNSGTGTQSTNNNPPTFPSPGGTVNTGNQPPPVTVTAQPTVIATATTTQPPPTSTPSTTTLTVQITSIPSRVRANSTVSVNVLTSEPGVTVILSITYNVPPFRGGAGPRTTDGAGNAVIPWHPSIFAFNNRFVTATVTAVAQDQNGQKARSTSVQVIIIVGGGGG